MDAKVRKYSEMYHFLFFCFKVINNDNDGLCRLITLTTAISLWKIDEKFAKFFASKNKIIFNLIIFPYLIDLIIETFD